MNKLDNLAYNQAFGAIFSKVKRDYPKFGVGKTLNGIIADWSDTQLQGLQGAIGEETANKVMKGCLVRNHYRLCIIQSVIAIIGAFSTLCKKSQWKSKQGFFNTCSSSIRSNWICYTNLQVKGRCGDPLSSAVRYQTTYVCY